MFQKSFVSFVFLTAAHAQTGQVTFINTTLFPLAFTSYTQNFNCIDYPARTFYVAPQTSKTLHFIPNCLSYDDAMSDLISIAPAFLNTQKQNTPYQSLTLIGVGQFINSFDSNQSVRVDFSAEHLGNGMGLSWKWDGVYDWFPTEKLSLTFCAAKDQDLFTRKCPDLLTKTTAP